MVDQEGIILMKESSCRNESSPFCFIGTRKHPFALWALRWDVHGELLKIGKTEVAPPPPNPLHEARALSI